jgi:hypothetical protein
VLLRKRVQRYGEEAQRLEDKREQKLLEQLSQRLPRHNPFQIAQKLPVGASLLAKAVCQRQQC